MRGFDPRWRDVPHFILGITREIWEERRIASLRHRYAPGLVVRSPAGVVVGSEAVIAATMATLAEFPDRELPGEDVIWCEDPARTDGDSEAFLSSHRLICWATHARPGMYGPASGRPLRYRIIADCAVRADAVDDEWLVRDQAAIVRQMGQDAREWARDLIVREGGPEACVKPFTPERDVPGPYSGRGNDDEWGQAYADLVSRIMAGEFDVIPRYYDRACALHFPGGVDTSGRAEADRFWMGLRAAFPDARITDAGAGLCHGHEPRRVRPIRNGGRAFGQAGIRADRRHRDLEADPAPHRMKDGLPKCQPAEPACVIRS